MLPWVLAFRESEKDEGSQLADTVLDCTWCKENRPKSVQALMGCGWMSPEDRTGNDYFVPNGAPMPDECPGYMITLPEVREAARALGWKKDGCIREVYPDGLTQNAIDLIDTVDSSLRAVERHSIRQARKKSKKK